MLYIVHRVIGFGSQYKTYMIEGFVSYLTHERRYSRHTVQAYVCDIQQFWSYAQTPDDEVSWTQITKRDVRAWIFSLMSGGMDPTSVNRKLSSLRSFYSFLRKHGMVDLDPTSGVDNVKTKKRLPQVLSETEVKRALEYSEQEAEEQDTLEALRDHIIFYLFYSTGIRRQELIELRWNNVQLQNGRMKVLGKGNKERLIPMISGLVRSLEGYRERQRMEQAGWTESSYVFASRSHLPLNPRKVYETIRRKVEAVSAQTKRSPHILRHSFATHMLDAGADLQAIRELLGHSSLAATQVYTHNSIEKLRNAYNLAHPKSGE